MLNEDANILKYTVRTTARDVISPACNVIQVLTRTMTGWEDTEILWVDPLIEWLPFQVLKFMTENFRYATKEILKLVLSYAITYM